MSAPAARAAAPRVDRATYRRLAGRAKLLSWVSLGYMALEGGIAILAGVLAGSVALIGFGLDSAIEGFASAIIVWRFTGARMFSEAAERRAQQLVAVQFFVLAPYVGFESMQALVQSERPDVSRLGIALSATSVVVMPYLGVAKQRIADAIGSAATKGEGRQNMLCAYLAGALLVGLLGNAAFGAWWLDPAVGLLIAGVAVREGVEAWRGEGCACTSDPLAGLRAEDDRSTTGGGMPVELPIACSLTPVDLAARLAEMGDLGRAALVDVRRGDKHAELRFAAAPGVRDRVRAIADAESRCCAFLALRVTGDADAVVLRIDAPEGAEPVLQELVDAFRGRPAAAH